MSKNQQKNHMELLWRQDRDFYRVWRREWDNSDMFEILSKEDFEKLTYFCKLFGISINQAED